jgi:ApaG protein
MRPIFDLARQRHLPQNTGEPHLGACQAVYSCLTNGVRVTVEPVYLEEESDPERGRFFWAYAIEIGNEGARTVQLLARHWRITDGNGHVEEVRGPGVVGEQPEIDPGNSFSYTSGCPLSTPSGIMVGSYQMVTANGEVFSVDIPAFSLDLPDARPVLN